MHVALHLTCFIYYCWSLTLSFNTEWDLAVYESSLFNPECSCWRILRRLFPNWSFLLYRNEETWIFKKFWSLPIFSTRLHKISCCLSSTTFTVHMWSSGVNSNVMKFVYILAWGCKSSKNRQCNKLVFKANIWIAILVSCRNIVLLGWN